MLHESKCPRTKLIDLSQHCTKWKSLLFTSALIVQSHDDRGVSALIVKGTSFSNYSKITDGALLPYTSIGIGASFSVVHLLPAN